MSGAAPPSVHAEGEADIRMGQSVYGEDLLDVVFFGCERLEKLSPRRDVAEQVPHFNDRARRTAGDANFGEDARIDLYSRAFVAVVAACRKREARYRRYGRNRLAAEAERIYLLDVAYIADFRRGLPFERKHCILPAHSATVVLDGHKLSPALHDGYRNLLRARVDGVFDQFLGDRGGALDYLASGDFVRHMERQYPYMPVAVRNQG